MLPRPEYFANFANRWKLSLDLPWGKLFIDKLLRIRYVYSKIGYERSMTMGTAAGSLDDPKEQAYFRKIWKNATRKKKHRIGTMVGKETTRLLKSRGRIPSEARAQLAQFVRDEIINKQGRAKR